LGSHGFWTPKVSPKIARGFNPWIAPEPTVRLATFALLATLIGLVAGCGKTQPTPSGSGDPAPAPAPHPVAKDDPKAAPDKERAQGVWVPVKLEGLPPEEVPFESALKAAVVSLKGDLLTISPGVERLDELRFVVSVDATKSPAWLDLTESDKEGRPTPRKEVALGIYKFEGDHLVVAIAEPGVPRPSEFKAVPPKPGLSDKASGLVLLVHLRKK
jgi:uncharacterized protein (TIGR03067 family)